MNGHQIPVTPPPAYSPNHELYEFAEGSSHSIILDPQELLGATTGDYFSVSPPHLASDPRSNEDYESQFSAAENKATSSSTPSRDSGLSYNSWQGSMRSRGASDSGVQHPARAHTTSTSRTFTHTSEEPHGSTKWHADRARRDYLAAIQRGTTETGGLSDEVTAEVVQQRIESRRERQTRLSMPSPSEDQNQLRPNSSNPNYYKHNNHCSDRCCQYTCLAVLLVLVIILGVILFRLRPEEKPSVLDTFLKVPRNSGQGYSQRSV